MMFFSKISLDLIALATGVALLILIKNQSKIKNFWPSLAAWFIIILSSLSIICSAFYTFKFWNYDFKMHNKMMMHKKMMENQKNMDQMQKKMQKNKDKDTQDNFDEE